MGCETFAFPGDRSCVFHWKVLSGQRREVGVSRRRGGQVFYGPRFEHQAKVPEVAARCPELFDADAMLEVFIAEVDGFHCPLSEGRIQAARNMPRVQISFWPWH